MDPCLGNDDLRADVVGIASPNVFYGWGAVVPRFSVAITSGLPIRHSNAATWR